MRGTVEEYKEKLDGVLLERDKAVLKEEQLGQLISNLNSRHREEMESLKGSFEKIINSQNEKMRVLEESRGDFESNFEQRELSLKNQL